MRRHHEIADQRELETAAGAHTVDGGDRDGHQVVDDGDGLLVHPHLPDDIGWLPVVELLDVVAGTKRVAGAAEDHDATLPVDGDLS